MTVKNGICVNEIKVGGVSAVEVTGLKRYSLQKTFDCGQCFRFEPSEVVPGAFEGVALGKFLRVYQTSPDNMTVLNCTEREFMDVWWRFFSLHRPWEEIEAEISAVSPVLARAAERAGDLRILTQDRFEVLCSFIISQCNNIPRIKKIISGLCEKYGDPILTPEKKSVYTFPKPRTITKRPISDLAELKMGYRDEYLYYGAEMSSVGALNEIGWKSRTKDSLDYLLSFKGIGIKVASCVLLFGFERYDVFPVDVWMKKVLQRYFPEGNDYFDFGDYAGVAQQYLFYCERYLGGIE